MKKSEVTYAFEVFNAEGESQDYESGFETAKKASERAQELLKKNEHYSHAEIIRYVPMAFVAKKFVYSKS